jgi:hypothetical protein
MADELRMFIGGEWVVGGRFSMERRTELKTIVVGLGG